MARAASNSQADLLGVTNNDLEDLHQPLVKYERHSKFPYLWLRTGFNRETLSVEAGGSAARFGMLLKEAPELVSRLEAGRVIRFRPGSASVRIYMR